MRFLQIGGTPIDGVRHLQIRVTKENECVVVDKETQEPIAGVTHWQVDMTRFSTSAKIVITITDPADIFVSQEVEGSIVHPIVGLPERIERNRQAMAELTRLVEESGDYD